MKLNVFIPSKNRAAQLHLLIESLRENFADFENLQFDILYTATNEKYSYAYNMLRKHLVEENINNQFWWSEQADFGWQFKYILSHYKDAVMFLTDDCIFYRPYETSVADTFSLLKSDDWCFSFRLGLNTTQQYYVTKEEQPHLDQMGYKVARKGFIRWNWKLRNPYQNYGYMFSWDGHIYNAKRLLNLIDSPFNNPRELESILQCHLRYLPLIGKYMVAPEKSCVVCNTINVVQDPPIPAGLFHNYSPEFINNKYLDGYLIDLDKMDFGEVVGCHNEYPIEFRKG